MISNKQKNNLNDQKSEQKQTRKNCQASDCTEER